MDQDDPVAAARWPAAVPAEPPLGRWWFGSTADEELAHRQGLMEAVDRASRRERRYDDPWWAANVRALLEYVAMLEQEAVERDAAVADADAQRAAADEWQARYEELLAERGVERCD